jgi:phosphoribosylaminoimidazole-succinocarboxamide synthase
MTDNMMKEKHWLDMEVIYRHILTRSMTDNMMKEKHWLDMEVIYRHILTRSVTDNHHIICHRPG